MIRSFLLAIILYSPVKSDRAEVVEINHVYDCESKKVFTQAIWWDYNRGEHVVIDWRIVTKPSIRPRRDRRGGYIQIWMDEKVLREVRSKDTWETWEQFDVELLDRQRFPQHERRLLLK